MGRLQIELGANSSVNIIAQKNLLAQAITTTLNQPSKPATKRSGVVPSMALVSSLVTIGNADAAVFEVQNLNDSGPGSLRQAITDANAAPTEDLITFQNGLNGTITLTSGQLEIRDDVLIQGPGLGNLTISGNNAYRAFYVYSPTGSMGRVELAGMTLSNGSANGRGGAIRSVTNTLLTVRDSLITGNRAYYGGGIQAYRSIVRIENSQINSNNAYSNGGAIQVDRGSLVVNNSTISGNTARDAGGGGIFAYAPRSVAIDNSIISNNTANFNGGGVSLIYQAGPAVISNSTISGNSTYQRGGGVSSGYYYRSLEQLTLDNVLITGNYARTYGGGIVANRTSLSVINTTDITNNDSYGKGGGIFFRSQGDELLEVDNSTINNNTAYGSGGGIEFYVNESALKITNSTISGNEATNRTGGGISIAYGSGDLYGSITIENATISDNTAYSDGGGINFEIDQLSGEIRIEDSLIDNNATLRSYGGGISFQARTLDIAPVIRNTTISNNTANYQGGGIRFDANEGVGLLLENSTLTGNSSGSRGGGAYIIVNDSFAFIRNTTFSGNTADYNGGGLAIDQGSYGRLFNTTITDNTANYGGGLYLRRSDSAIISSIISGNTGLISNDDVGGMNLYLTQFSLIGSLGSTTLNSYDNTNIVGQDPLLGPLQDNGGPTFTHALGAGSPAIDTGINSAPAAFDQRGPGFPRMVGIHTDMGAVESSTVSPLAFPAATQVVTNLNDSGVGSLRQAVIDSNAAPGADVIEFQAGLSGTVTLTSGEMQITDDLVINAPVPSVITISGNDASRIFNIYSPGNAILDVELVGLTLTNGYSTEYGGAVRNYNEIVTVRDSVLSNNSSTGRGGAISSGRGVLRLIDTMVTANTASGYGGGIHSGYQGLVIRDSVVSNNSAQASGGVFVGANRSRAIAVGGSTISSNTASYLAGGLGMRNLTMSVSVSNSTVSDNVVTGNYGAGGILFNDLQYRPGGLEIDNTDITGNSGASSGGGVQVYGGLRLEITNTSTINGNTALYTGGGVAIRGSSPHASALIEDSTINNNVAQDRRGGGIALYNDRASLTVHNTSINNNTANYTGGGISVENDALKPISILNSTVSGNSMSYAGSRGGGIFISGDIYAPILFDGLIANNNTAGGRGGGISGYSLRLNSPWTVRNSTISNNTAGYGGGFQFENNNRNGSLIITGSTISGNSATNDGGGLDIDSRGGSLEVQNSTISGNTAGGDGGGLRIAYADVGSIDSSTITDNQAAQNGGALYVGSNFTIRSSIIADNVATVGADNLAGSGNNAYLNFSLLDDVTITGTLSLADQGFNLFGQDPLLAVLASNGGSTLTQLPGSGSPAINRGLNFGVPITDQRGSGFPRLEGGRIDIGAVEATANQTLSFNIAGSPFAENGGIANVTATLDEAGGVPIVLTISLSGTATLNTDFTASDSIIFIPDGDLAGTNDIALTGLDDTIDETPNETVLVDGIITFGPAIPNPAQQTAIIADDDNPPTVSLGLTGSPLAENGGVATVTATLSNLSNNPVVVDFGFSGTAGGADFTAPVSLTIPALTNSGSIDITGVDDNIDEVPDETVVVDITGVTNGTENGAQQVTATITDDDPTPLVSLALSGSPLIEDGGVATVTANLSNPSNQAITVNLAFSGTASGGDFTAPASMTIPALSTSASIDITGVVDNIDEPNETVVVDISGVTNGIEDGVQQVTATIADDDQTPEVSLAFGAPINEAGGNIPLTANLTNPSSQAITVDLTFGGTAQFGSDFTAPLSIVIPPLSNSNGINVSVIDDPLDEDDETVTAEINNVTNGVAGSPVLVQTSILDNDDPPDVDLTLTGSPFDENGGSAVIGAALSAISGRNVTVDVSFSGTATNPDDYTSSGASIVIPAGSVNSTSNITLNAVDDPTDEPDETVVADVANLTNGLPGTVQQVTATITDDDDPPTVQLSASGSLVAENGGTATVTATLSTPSAFDVTVDLAISGTATAGDFSLPASILIPAGQPSADITLTAIDDPVDEPDEDVVIDITGVTNGTEDGAQQATVTITDDDQTPLVDLALAGSPFSENGGAATLTASLSNPSSQAITVDLGFSGTADSSDFTAPANIVIPALSTSMSVSINGSDDALDEADETIVVDVAGVTNGVENGVQQVIATIDDDDNPPDVNLTLSGSPFNENGGSATIGATLSTASGLDVTIDVAFSGTATDPDDYTASGTSITIPAGSTRGSTDITLIAVDDPTDEPDETVIADVASLTNGLPGTVQQVTATLTDDDDPPTVELSLLGSPLNEDGGTAMVTATLSTLSAFDVTVDLATSGTADGTEFTLPNSILIPAGQPSADITLTSIDDTSDEPDETVIVDIDSVTNGAEDGEQQITATIIDDDDAPIVQLSLTGDPIAENGGTATVTATLSNTSAFDITVDLGTSGSADAGDFTLPATIVVPPDTLSADVTLTAVDDTLDEPDETVIVDITAVTNGTEDGTQQVTATISDDDDPPTLALSLTGDPIAENGGTGTITATLSAASSFDVTANLAISGTADASDFTLPDSITVPALSTTADITLTAVDDALDETDETVVVDVDTVDNGTEDGTQQVTATITDDEAPPLITIGLSLEIIGEGDNAEIVLSLSEPSGQDIVVELGFSGTATMPDDYTVSSTTVTIPAGETSGSILITTMFDGPGDPDETIIIDIVNVTNAVEDGEQQVTITLLEPIEVPTMSTWGKLAMMLMLPFTAFLAMRRRRQTK